MLSLTNATLSDNDGCIYNVYGGQATIRNVTIDNTRPSYYHSIDNGVSGGTITLQNSLLSGTGTNCTGAITSLDHNLDSGTSCGFNQPHDISNANPQLGTLQINAPGTTPTLALLPGSPAIDSGGTAANGCPTTDQRGVTRPQGAACDIGAYEFAPPSPAPVSGVTPNYGSVAGGESVTITGSNFHAGAAVSFGGVPSPNVTVMSATQIVAITPANATGRTNVTVLNTDGSSGTLPGGFDYKERPGPIAPGGPPNAPPPPRTVGVPPGTPAPPPVPPHR